MKNMMLFAITFSILGTNLALADNSDDRGDGHHHRKQAFRMDCRFYDHHGLGEHDKFNNCVSSATYTVHHNRDGQYISDIRYGVRCEDQTLYNNEGVAFSTNQPDSLTEDHIRPITSAVPKTKIFWQGALVKEGTYDADLELSEKILKQGSCDITTAGHGRHRD